MSKVGLLDYNNGTKNNWRNKHWNRAAGRLKNKKNSVVLYLAAKGDKDRKKAISKGFRSNNLIAVDWDKKTVEHLRKEQKLAIHGTLHETMLAYGPVDVIYADFCNGLTESNLDFFLDAIAVGLNSGGVLIGNMLRGRENDNALVREFCTDVSKNTNALLGGSAPIAHRGFHAVISMVYAITNLRIGCSRLDEWRQIVSKDWSGDSEFRRYWDLTVDEMSPVYDSYKNQSGRYFDSFIVSTEWDPILDYSSRKIRKSVNRLANQKFDSDICNQVRAIKAVRTMRQRGTLAPCSNF